MPVGTVNAAKELASGYQSLLLATVTFSDGAIARYATHDLSGPLVYDGNAYSPRIVNQEIAATAALSEQGIDIPATVHLRLSDPDFYEWNNREKTHGFKGSSLELRFVFLDIVTGAFSSDYRVVFRGVCREPGGRMAQHDGKTLTVGFVSRLMLSDTYLPAIKIQRTCPWVFPSTLQERTDAANTPASEYYRCGYSPDVSGGNARGNYQSGSTPYTSCGYTKAECVARGMYNLDSSSRSTKRFGGIQYSPKDAAPVREFGGKWAVLQNPGNQARYGDYVPQVFGTAMIEPVILTTAPDGNFLKMEALVCDGSVSFVWKVIVNDVEIPHTYDDTKLSIVPPGVNNATEAHRGGWWKCTSDGNRTGGMTDDPNYLDASGNPAGDPFGSYTVLLIAVPRKLADAGQLPRVRVLCRRGSTNPADQVYELLTEWGQVPLAEVNSTAAAAFVCNTSVAYTNQHGVSSTHEQFKSSFVLRQRESLADILRGVRNSCRGLLGPDSSGVIDFRIKRTLADQQPATVAGSNYNTAVSSITASGSAANGYVAYRFTESEILEFPKVRMLTAGNIYGLQFQNEDNFYSTDAFNPIDTDDFRRVNRDLPGQVSFRGVPNYDQLRRLIATYVAEQYRGNWAGDTKGTLELTFPTTYRSLHLRIGDIVMVDFSPLSIAAQLFRLTAISPETNFERATITVAWHNDLWYTYTYGQGAIPRFSSRRRGADTLPRPWSPFRSAVVAGDSLDPQGYTFDLAQRYVTGPDGRGIAEFVVEGKHLVNRTTARPNPPAVPLQGSSSYNAFSSLAAERTYYAAFVAVDSAGQWSDLSDIVVTRVPTGSNTVTVPSLQWDAGSVAWVGFLGDHPEQLFKQVNASGSGTPPSSIEFGRLDRGTEGPPDPLATRYRVRAKQVLHSGHWALVVSARTSSTITLAVPGAGFATNAYAGYDISRLGRPDYAGSLPPMTYRIQSNTSNVLTLVSGPDPVTGGLQVGDLMVMRAKPTVGSDVTGTYLEDAMWQSVVYPSGMVPGEEVGRLIRIIGGTGKGLVAPVLDNTATKLYADWPITLDSTTRFIVEAPVWEVDQRSGDVSNGDPTADVSMVVPVANRKDQTWIVQVVTEDARAVQCNESFSPVREIFQYGLEAVGGYGNAVTLIVPGTLAIGADLCPRVSLRSDVARAKAVTLEVKDAPVGAALQAEIRVAGTVWLTLSLAAGATSVEATEAALDTAGAITAGDNISLDLAPGVGTTFPGADLTVTIYL